MKNAEILQDCDAELPNIYCDVAQIKQVFVHVLQNAIESIQSKGKIEIQIFRYDYDQIKVRFNDQGCGISDKRMNRIGEPFYSIKEKGTGFGLMSSYKIVQEHSGTIEVKSIVNHGTTVDITLPINHSF